MAVTSSSASAASNGTHLEVEIKLDADPGFTLPDLTDLPGVTAVERAGVHELAAVYLDTADLALARHDTTLRRRTGGDDEGWHLKLPHAKKGRLEIRRPLDDGTGDPARQVPAKLTRMARAQLLGAPVSPVARIGTVRTVHRLLGADGVVLAELCDDQVRGETLGGPSSVGTWREIEVELVHGDDALLDAAQRLLVAAGARAGDTSSKLRRVLRARLARLEVAPPEPSVTAAGAVLDYLSAQVQALIAEDPRVRADEHDSVHQMRVSTRRLRTALAGFRPLFETGAADQLRAELKWLADLLGVARDAEVMRAGLTARLADEPSELVLGPVRRRIDLELGGAYRDAHANVVAALDGQRFVRLVAALEHFVAQPPVTGRGHKQAPKQLAARVRRAYRRVHEAVIALDGLTGDALDHQMHQVRIAAKRVRYTAEASRSVAGRDAKAVAGVMEQVQETLGRHQDAVVERQWLRDLGIRAFLAGENGFTFGRLHGLADGRARLDEDEFEQVWVRAQQVVAAWPGA